MKKILLTGVAMMSLSHAASAAIVLTLSGTSGSSIVHYEFSGSGTYVGGGSTGIELVITNAGDVFDELSLAADDQIIPVTALFTNDTTTTSVGITQFVLDHDGGAANDDFEFQFGLITFSNGDAYSISGEGDVDLADTTALTFDDLNLGSYRDASDSDDVNFGGIELVIVEVPEPSSALLLGLGGLGLLARRRRA